MSSSISRFVARWISSARVRRPGTIFTFLGCALGGGAASTPDVTATATVEEGLAVRGPTRLQGECFDTNGGHRVEFELEAPRDPVALIPLDPGAFVEIAVGPAGTGQSVLLRTLARDPVTGVGHLSREVTAPAAAVGDAVELDDPTLLEGTTLYCQATLITVPTTTLIGVGTSTWSLSTLTNRRATIELPLPNHVACGVEIAFATPPSAEEVDVIASRIARSATDGAARAVTWDYDLSRGVVTLRVPDAKLWSAELALESTDGWSPLALAFGREGTIGVLACP